MLREERVAEYEHASMDQDNDESADERCGSCILGVLCVLAVIIAVALLAPVRADEVTPQPVLELVR